MIAPRDLEGWFLLVWAETLETGFRRRLDSQVRTSVATASGVVSRGAGPQTPP